MANAKTHTVTLPFKKETKNMLQFQSPDDDKTSATIPTLYVSKGLFKEGEWPAALKITVEGVAK